MANTAMSDSGAMSSPTVWTSPDDPRRASSSSIGVRAASSGVRPSNSGIGSSPSPSRHTYSSCFTGSASELHDQREVLRVQAGPADQRAVDVGVGHELADVGRLHAP